MAKLEFTYTRVPADEKKYGKGYAFLSVTEKEFSSFDSNALGIGDVSSDGKYVQALAAIYDLQGFTSFCNQVDSHLVIPEFLQRFVDWLFSTLTERVKEGVADGKVTLWSPLPFYTKFLGDGVLLLWDAEMLRADKIALFNIVDWLHQVSAMYTKEFIRIISKHVSNPPPVLRCGVARGQVISIGNGSDYVGSCINVASRLQKLSGLLFAVSRRGMDFSTAPSPFLKSLVLKKVELRGVGGEELVYVIPKEFNELAPKEKLLFKEP
jgi:class 3 adenylate cyclase